MPWLPVRALPPCAPSTIAGTRHRPIPSVHLVGGPLAAWQQHNGEATIPHCIEQLEARRARDGARSGWSRATPPTDGSRSASRATSSPAPSCPGALYVLDLDLTPRPTTAHHRVDALRGAVAVERGPVAYCVEHTDLDAPFDIDDFAVLPAPITIGERDTLVLPCRVINAADGLYGPTPLPSSATSTQLMGRP